jgi:competence protein ComEA
MGPGINRQTVGLTGLCVLALGGMSYVGSLQSSPAPPASFQTNASPAASKPASVATSTEPVVVHVVGAVNSPGLVTMPAGSRVIDAIKRVGGSKADADMDAINLAAKLVDGTQLMVPHKNVIQSPSADSTYSGGDNSYVSESASPKPNRSVTGGGGGPVSLNTASAAQLDALPGVGPATAKKIIDYRLAHGGFGSIEELMSVKGIGPKKFAKMKSRLRM